MRKIIFLFIFITFILSSCEPAINDPANTSSDIAGNSNTNSSASQQDSSAEELKDPHTVNDGESTYTLLLQIPIGEKDNEVGYLTGQMSSFDVGPSAFNVSSDGNVTILDYVNKKIISFKDNELVEKVDLSVCSYAPINFTSDADRYYIIDEDNNFYIINRSDNSCEKKIKLDKEYIERITIENKKQYFFTYTHQRFLFNDDKLIDEGMDIQETTEEDSVTIKANGLEWTIDKIATEPIQKSIGAISIDKYNNLYVGQSEEIYNQTTIIENSIRKYDKNGYEVGYTIPDFDNNVVNSLHPVIITDNGDIYIMLCKENFVGIYEVTLGKLDKSQVDEWLKDVSKVSN